MYVLMFGFQIIFLLFSCLDWRMHDNQILNFFFLVLNKNCR